MKDSIHKQFKSIDPQIQQQPSEDIAPQPKSYKHLIIFISLLALVFLGASVYLYFQLQVLKNPPKVENWWPENGRVLAVPSPSPSSDPTPIIETDYGSKYDFESKHLKLSFTYPINWGEVEEALRSGDIGKQFNLSFNNDPGGSALGFGNITAGGRTKVFGDGRGGYIADAARGFSSYQEVCDSYIGKQGFSCEEIVPNVVVQLVVPKFKDACPPQPGGYWFSKRVWVNLTNQEVDGFMLEYSNFWSDQFEEMSSEDLDCQKTDEQKFEAMVLKITNKLKSGDLDQITKDNLAGFDEFVKSIKI